MTLLSVPIKKKKRLGKALREYKQTITLSQIQKDVLVGTLLGDASMPLHSGKPKLYVEFKQTIGRANYIHHLYDLFQDPVGRPGRETRSGDPVGRLCWHTSTSTEYSWRWRAGSTMYLVSNL